MQLAINAYGRTLSSEQFNVNLAAPNSRQLTGANAGGGAVQLSGTTGLFGRPVQWLGGVDGSYLATRVHIYAVPPGGDSLTASVRTRERDVAALHGSPKLCAINLIPPNAPCRP